MVVAGNEDGELRAWRTGTWQPIPFAAPRVVHRGAVTAVAFAPDGTLLTSGGDDIRVWDFDPLRLRAVFPTGGPRTLLRFSPDGQLLIHGGPGMPMEVWGAGAP
jgi:WD40 repeat protein